MKAIETTERKKYELVWQDDRYRQVCHGSRLWSEHPECFPSGFRTAIDIGCGLGLMVKTWNDLGIDAWGIDIAGNSLCPEVRKLYGYKVAISPLWQMAWQDSLHFDVGLCADVLEHIPEDRLSECLRRIANWCDHVVLKIDHEPCKFLGEDLHLILRPVEWWLDQMGAVAGSAKHVGNMARMNGAEGSVVVWSIR
jgi:2-polyprenyl-3-methyl-5-hydroxy-6-metoxy-1,4-benzoquinol methylase